jgi:outer membrane receptor protein involved in Fe transport
MNPYVNASDPLNLTAGNPKLKPELTRMLEFGHSYEGDNGFSLNTALYYNANSNAIEQIMTVDPSGVSFSTSQNIAAYKRLGANINTSFKLNPNWSVNAGGELSYLKFNARSMNLQNKGTFYTVNLSTTYTLPKNYSLLISGDYGNGYITLQGRNSANYSYSLAARKELFNKKASLTLTANNPFQKNFMQKSSATAASFESNTSSWFYNRSASLSFSWQFGGFKQQDHSEKESSNENENRWKRRTK